MIRKLMLRAAKAFRNEDGVGTIEVVLLIVVIVALVIIFKKQILSMISAIFSSINDSADELY